LTEIKFWLSGTPFLQTPDFLSAHQGPGGGHDAGLSGNARTGRETGIFVPTLLRVDNQRRASAFGSDDPPL